jgi:hypothetical protein
MYLLNFAQAFTDSYSNSNPTFTTTTTSTGPFPWGALMPFLIIFLVMAVIAIVSLWKIFQKAGKPGWAAIVPVYNEWVLFELTGFPGWLSLLIFVPFANFIAGVVAIMANFKLVKLFGKGDGFAVATIFFPYVTLPIVAFGKSQFQGVPGQSGQAGGQQYNNSGYPPQQPPQNPYNQQPNPTAQAGPIAPAPPQQYPTPPVDQLPPQQPPKQQPPVPPASPQQ